jgi:hypothetical protein
MMGMVAVFFSVSMTSALLTPVVRRRTHLKMQYGGYGQQPGYAQQDPWAIPTCDDSSGQQLSYGAQAQWRIDAAAGVAAMPQTSFPALPKYHVLPYFVGNREDQVLGRCNMMQKTDHVERVQCMVRILADGQPTLVGCGQKAPTLVRSRSDGQWSYLYKGDKRILVDGDQVSLDCYNPEGAVFTCTDLQGGYGQQQGGGQLPPGWITGVDQGSGQTYYYNEQTGQSQWDPPQY